MRATLIVVAGAKRKRIVLRLPTAIGRGSRADLKLRASDVSRTHCKIYEDNGSLLVRDLGSSNGTKVNGRRFKKPPSFERTI